MDKRTLISAMGNQYISDEECAAFNLAMRQAFCNTVDRAAMWCAQLGHESAGLKYYEEIASGADYEGRSDLGNVFPGDGRRYKGRGPIQVTGRRHYENLSRWAYEQGHVPTVDFFVLAPDQLATIGFGFLGAVWYWTTQRPLTELSDRRDIVGATRAINGGTHGLQDREQRYRRCLTLGDALLPTDDGGLMAEEAKDLQLQSRGPDLQGWRAWRHGLTEDQQPRYSQTDFLRVLDRELNSVFDVKDAPTGDQGTLVGQILALRKEVQELSKIVKELSK